METKSNQLSITAEKKADRQISIHQFQQLSRQVNDLADSENKHYLIMMID